MLRYAQGDCEAFEELFSRHKQSVYAFIKQFMANMNLADDLFQEVFIKIIRNRTRYRPKAKFTTWLFSITRSVCIDAIRKQGTANVISLFPEFDNNDSFSSILNIGSHEKSPREMMVHTETSEAVIDIIQSLPEKQREVLLLREKTNLTFEEIGKVIDCSANTAKSRMHYALLSLKTGLIERGFQFQPENAT